MPTVLPNVSVPEAMVEFAFVSEELRIAYVPETESEAAAPIARRLRRTFFSVRVGPTPRAYWSTCHVMPKVDERPWSAFWLFPDGCGK